MKFLVVSVCIRVSVRSIRTNNIIRPIVETRYKWAYLAVGSWTNSSKRLRQAKWMKVGWVVFPKLYCKHYAKKKNVGLYFKVISLPVAL